MLRILLTAILLFACAAQADEDIDDVITNAALRAESGSKSRWSLASIVNYNGGSLEKPLDESRPNIAATTGTFDESLLDGQISVKYNLSTRNALMAGLGVRWIAPLQAHPKNNGGDRADADNPYLIYQYLYRWWGIEAVLQLQPTYYTNLNLVKQGYVSSLLINQDNMTEIGKTGLSLGFSVWVQGGIYNKSGPVGQPGDVDYLADAREDQADYLAGLSPVLEYAFTDSVNFRSIWNMWNFEHLRSFDNAATFKLDTQTISVGLGISVTRDIFIYPNVQFQPEHIRADMTNVAINTNINLF